VGTRESEEILINIAGLTDTAVWPKPTTCGLCGDYSALAQKVQAHAETAARFTVEALAEDLAKICLEEKGVEKAIVRVEKPGAVRSSKSVGGEIERTQSRSEREVGQNPQGETERDKVCVVKANLSRSGTHSEEECT